MLLRRTARVYTQEGRQGLGRDDIKTRMGSIMKSAAARQRRKAKRKAKQERVISLLVQARLDGINVEPLKGLPEYALRSRLKEMYLWKEAYG